MGKSVEEKLKSATRHIAGLKRQIAELEDVIQAHKTVAQWRQASHLSKDHAEAIVSGIEARRGKSVIPRIVGTMTELSAPYGGYDCRGGMVVDDPYVEPTVGETMAEAHRVLDLHETFSRMVGKRTGDVYARVHDDMSEMLNRDVAATMGVPSEFIGVDMADSPGSHAEVEASIERGNIILKETFVPHDPQAELFKVLEGQDPNCTYDVWMWTAERIAKVYRHDVIGGVQLLHDWSSGSLGGFPLPVTYSEQTVNCVWAALTEAKHG